MRFKSSSKQPPYLNRRDQRRLLYLFGLLVLVLIGMKTAANPNTWSWMFAGNAASDKTDETKKSGKSSPLGGNEVRASTSSKSSAKTQVAKTTKVTPDGNDLPAGIVLPTTFDDRELGIGLGEWPAYVAVLDHVMKADVAELREKAKQNVSFTKLRQTPEELRGSLIHIEGRLGSLRKIPPPKNDHGLGQLYEAWIVTAASDNLPYRVVFSELPDGLEPQDLYQPPHNVRVTGYFFKVQKYEAKPNGEKWRYENAPLLLARRIDLVEPPDLSGLSLAPYVISFALIVGGILAFAMWRFTRGDKQFAAEHLSRFEEQKHEEATGLNRHEAGESPEEFFARLSEDDGESKS